ncbi:hypothetical protein HYH02_005361 [Chlamydomonas schloesseri]|uniref:Uncharacterized protein n=1 Tax=Chlamydomonas schloesseri TaxID=2026947 RepID=A0A835WM98_9CHLO|nr:hypothetical protein HYH02_005361 [Chlamydomonas schloesseri]|eukprot:KAG2449838.1 hypothetical protein HYH02_005361 [Chlamydomonas schloesseri]
MSHLGAALGNLAPIERVVAEMFGPHGLDQLLTDEANQATITNDGSVVLRSAAPEDPLAALLLKLVTDSCAATGDGCKRLLLMVLAGLRQHLRSGLHPLAFQATLAAQVLQCAVPSAVLHVPLAPGYQAEVEQALGALITTHLGGKLGGAAAADHLGQCLQELVLVQLEAAARAGISAAQALAGLSTEPPLVRLPGAAPDQSQLLPGLVLREGPFGGGALPAAVAALESGPAPFLALSCALEGEDIGVADTSVANRQASGLAALAGAGEAAGAATGGGQQQPAVGVLVTSAAERERAQTELMAQLRRRLAAVALRGVKLLLLCGRPPDQAAQLCAELGLVLVAGLEEQEVAQACAAGGTAPLSRVGLAELAAAPVGRAATARVIGLGGRRALLLEFDLARCTSGQVARSLLLCGPTEAAVRQSARALTRCLVSLAAAIGTMARPRPHPAPHAAPGAGSLAGQREGGPGDAGGDGEDGGGGGGEEEEEEAVEEAVECLVFVAGGGGFEGLLEMQLRELLAVATRGPDAAAAAAGGEEGDAEDEDLLEARGQRRPAAPLSVAEAAAVGEAAAEEADSLSQLAGSLRVLHAMAAAVPLALAGGGGGGGGGAATATGKRRQREALLQVHALRRAQAAALQAGAVSACGLVVPAAAYSHCGRALRRTRTEAGQPPGQPDSHPQATSGTTTGAGVGPGPRAGGVGRHGAGANGAAASASASASASARGGTAMASKVGGGSGVTACNGRDNDDGGVRGRPLLGGYDFVAGDAVAHGVLEPAAVAAGLWGAAVEVLVQVLRIDGAALPATAAAARHGASGGPGLQAAGAAPAAGRPAVRRGGRFGRAGTAGGGRRGSDSSGGVSSSSNGGGGRHSDASSEDWG